jgi:hypothetical protein
LAISASKAVSSTFVNVVGQPVRTNQPNATFLRFA